MSGFPLRVTRSQLGPRMRNTRPVDNPETDVGEQLLNTLMDQVAGSNVITPRASLIARWNGSAFDVAHQAESWNTDGSQAHPQLARSAIGRYTYLFAPSYLDGEGNQIATALPAPRVTVHEVPVSEAALYLNISYAMSWIDPTNPLRVKIALNDATGNTGVDWAFWLEVA
jgi:hypothetical protein